MCLRRFRGNDVYTFWDYRPAGVISQRKGGKTVKKEVSDGKDRSETGTDRRAADARILREFEEGKNKQFKNVAGSFIPSKTSSGYAGPRRHRTGKKSA